MTEQALVTIRHNFQRPSPEIVERFSGVPTGWAVDARGRRGALDYRIRPTYDPPPPFAGPALTVATVARDNLAPYAALREAKPGDVLVIANGAYEGSAVVGDLFIGMAKNCGIVAVVTDGLVRDIAGIEEIGIPVFARGLTPNSPEKHGPGEIGLPVSLGGVVIAAGDIVIGDRDGVAVIPQNEIEAVLAELATIKAKEEKAEAAIRGGATQPGWLDEALEAKGVRYVD